MSASNTSNPTAASLFFDDQITERIQDAAQETRSFYQKHFTHSKKAILEAAQPLTEQRGSALFLGWGGGCDMPELSSLAPLFTHIKLVDMGIKSAEAAVQALPEEMRSQFSVEEGDLSCTFAALEAKLEELKKDKPPFPTFIAIISEFISQLAIKPYDCSGAPFSFVCSSLVSSQLGREFFEYLNNICWILYRQPLPPENRILDAFTKLGDDLTLKHFQDLRRLVHAEGRVYFSDNFAASGVAYMTSAIGKDKLFLGEKPIGEVKTVQANLFNLFNPIDTKYWKWSLPVKTAMASVEVTNPDGSIEVLPAQMVEVKRLHITAFTLIVKA